MENTPKETAGIFYYESKPDNIRIAKKDDFFKNGLPNIKMWFLIHGYHENHFEAYQVKNDFDINKILPWLNDNRIYVKSS